MKRLFAISSALCTLLLSAWAGQTLPAPADENHAAVTETRDERNLRMAWWRKAKFGMFIHYGLYSGLGGEFCGIPGGAEWIQKNLELDTVTYFREAKKHFQPAKGCAEAWAALAEEAGCRYMVLTTKHHEGFALFETSVSDYCSAVLVGRDLVKEFCESARRHGMKVGFYHSVIDWHHHLYDNSICPDLCYPKRQNAILRQKDVKPDQKAYKEYLHHQVKELLTNYGPVDMLWWDYSQGSAEGELAWGAPALMTMCRALHPGIIMNNRLYAYSGFDSSCDTIDLDLRCGDYRTPEKRIPEQGYPGMDWETCMTVGDKWGYNRYDVNIKSPATVIAQLEECAAKGGNLLLNIGPKGDGSIPEALADVFKRVGAWMRVNGEAIYESSPVPSVHMPEGWMASIVGEETYVFPPALQPEEPVVLRILAREIDTVEPSVLGQPDCEVTVRRVEEEVEGKEEPEVYMEFTIPAQAWADAVEGMPVLKFSNAN